MSALSRKDCPHASVETTKTNGSIQKGRCADCKAVVYRATSKASQR